MLAQGERAGRVAAPEPDHRHAVAGAGRRRAGRAPAAAPDPREATLANAVLQLLEEEHLLRPKIDDKVSQDAFKSYLERLDGAKMFLLASDRDALAVYRDKIGDELHSGRLDLAHEGEKRFAARVALVEGWVAQILTTPMTFTTDEYFETDPKKLEPAKTDDELRDRWRRRLELEVLERVTAMEASLDKDKESKAKPAVKDAKGAKDAKDVKDANDAKAPDPAILKIPATPELREAKAREELARAYAARFARLKTPPAIEAASDLMNAVTSSIDPHTDYLPPADKANFDIAMTGSLEGIGAVLREKDHLIEINELVPGGASFRQGGLAPGDLILSVVPSEGKEAVDVYDMPIEDVVHMIRGPKGTVVRLRVQKASGETTTVAITRDVVVIESAYARGAVLQKRGGPAYGYILLPSFYGGQNIGQRTAAGDVAKLLSQMKAKRVAGVILDIRSNGGGLLTDAVKMVGELVDTGPVVQVQDSRGKRQTLSDDVPGELYDGPVIVLVDQFSASASEIVAAALQDYHRAVIVGTGPTHGKGTVQTVVDIDRVMGSNADLRLAQAHDRAVLPHQRRIDAARGRGAGCGAAEPGGLRRHRRAHARSRDRVVAHRSGRPHRLEGDVERLDARREEHRARREESDLVEDRGGDGGVARAARRHARAARAHGVPRTSRRAEGGARRGRARSGEDRGGVHRDPARGCDRGRASAASDSDACARGGRASAGRLGDALAREPRARSVGRRVPEHLRRHQVARTCAAIAASTSDACVIGPMWPSSANSVRCARGMTAARRASVRRSVAGERSPPRSNVGAAIVA